MHGLRGWKPDQPLQDGVRQLVSASRRLRLAGQSCCTISPAKPPCALVLQPRPPGQVPYPRGRAGMCVASHTARCLLLPAHVPASASRCCSPNGMVSPGGKMCSLWCVCSPEPMAKTRDGGAFSARGTRHASTRLAHSFSSSARLLMPRSLRLNGAARTASTRRRLSLRAAARAHKAHHLHACRASHAWTHTSL